MELRTAVFVSLFVLFLAEAKGSDFSSECKVWRNITTNMMRMDPLNVTCTVNPTCSGTDCSGEVKILRELTKTLRFGVSFIPCSDPLQFEVFVSVDDDTLNMSLSVNKSQPVKYTRPIPGLTQSTVAFSSEANLIIALTSSVSPAGMQIIITEMNATVKITKPAPYYNVFVLIPRVEIPAPACITAPTVFNEPFTSAYSEPSEWTGGKCEFLSADNGCKGENEMCVKGGNCSCAMGFTWNKEYKKCVSSQPEANKSSAGPDIWIVVAGVIGAAVLLAGVLIVVVHKYRRNRARYGQHTLLVNSDNDTELDDPDAPMLTG